MEIEVHPQPTTGSSALSSNTIGIYNTVIGHIALDNQVIGNNNTALGSGALLYTLNSNNSATGFSAGTDSDNSTFCTYLGNDADNDFFSGSYTNSTAIGNGSRMTASNQVRIGNSAITSIGGFEPWTDVSDGRFKKDIHENVPGLDFIIRLRPITYHLDVNELARQLHEDDINIRGGESVVADQSVFAARNEKSTIVKTGFIAQEVEAAALEIGYDFSGVDAPKSENELYGLRYSQFVVPLVKAVQEQQMMIEELKKKIEELEKSER